MKYLYTFSILIWSLAACGAAQPQTPAGATNAPDTNVPGLSQPTAIANLPVKATQAVATSTPAASSTSGILATLLGGNPIENIYAAISKAESGGAVRISGTTTWTAADGRTTVGKSVTERIPKDRMHIMNTSAAGTKSEIIRIGDTTYTRANDGAWRKTTVTLPTPAPSAADASDDSATVSGLRALKDIPEIKPVGVDVINGVPVTGIAMTIKPSAESGPGGGDGTLTFWISADGLIRKSEMLIAIKPSDKPALTLPTPRAGATVDPQASARRASFDIILSAVSMKNTRLYEYDPGIKIEAPIP